MIIVIGEILIDRFPEYERIGGAPFNFAFHLKNMGWPVRFLSRIGDDADGQKISRVLDKNGFDMHDIQIDNIHPTGRVDVALDNRGVPQFHILENAAYDYIDLSLDKDNIGSGADMIYYGSLAQRTRQGFDQVQDFLQRNNFGATRFCDINLRPPHVNTEAVEASLYHADILKLNDDELETVATLFKGPERTGKTIKWVMQTFKIAKIALTHGAEGSTLITNIQTVKSPPKQISQMVDTVGAGDAYASVLAAGTLKGLPVERTLDLAAGFAARICSLPGAVPKDPQVYATVFEAFERKEDAR